MKPLAVLGAVALFLLVSAPAAAIGNQVSISIVDAPRPQTQWGYAPPSRSVAPGTWVTWSNAGQDAHTVTAVDGSFDSGNLDPSEGFSWYFDQPGTYAYMCSLHPWMTGTIVVSAGGAQTAPPPAAQQTSGSSSGSDSD